MEVQSLCFNNIGANSPQYFIIKRKKEGMQQNDKKEKST